MGNKRRSISKRFGDSAEKSNSSSSGFIEPNGNVKELIEAIKKEFMEEISALKAEVNELRNSQAFISQQYDDLKSEYSKVLTANKEQKKEIGNLKSDSANLKMQGVKEIEKVDALEQYGRRQNLEIVGVSVKDNENTNAIVLEVARLMNVKVEPHHISISHRLPIKLKDPVDSARKPHPVILARFTNRDIRNQLFANRNLLRSAKLSNFSVPGTEKIFVNENLTEMRKRLFWMVKQKAPKMGYVHYWTANGNVLVRKSDESNPITIKNDLDLNLIK